MFTGLVETVGLVTRIDSVAGGAQLEIYAPDFGRDMAIGDSVAVNGACLTIIKFERGGFLVDVSSQTLDTTALGRLRNGSKVNLERAMRLSDRLGGHIVQGHVDGVGQLVQRQVAGNSTLYHVAVPEEIAGYLVEKGSIAVDGISLTIARVRDNTVAIAVIPHTESSTTLGDLQIGSPVNLEVDIIAKYVRRYVSGYVGEGGDIANQGKAGLADKIKNFMEGY